MRPVPQALTVGALRDFVTPPGDAEHVVSFGMYHIPDVLMRQRCHLPVDVQGVLSEPPRRAPTDTPSVLAELNARFLLVRQFGCGVPRVFIAECYEGDVYPTLHRAPVGKLRQLLRGREAPDGRGTLADWFLLHPFARRYDRLILTPMEPDDD